LLHCLGNPLEEKHSAEGDWKDQVATRLKKLKKLDGQCYHTTVCCIIYHKLQLLGRRF